MASACLNRVTVSPENLMDCSPKYSSYRWLTHRRSISNESDASNSKYKTKPAKNVSDPVSDPHEESEFDGFEFRLEDPVVMLPADELFSDGKLVPMQFSVNRNEAATSTVVADSPDAVDPYLYSPRAPRCSSRWKELLGFGKHNQTNNNNNNNNNNKRSTLSSSSSQNTTGANTTSKSIRQLLYNRSSKSSVDSSINLPLLKDIDTESVSISSRPSLTSSSSSGNYDIDDLPRLSLDSNKPNPNPSTRPKTRLSKPKPQSTESKPSSRVGRSTDAAIAVNRCLSVDSPRMNSSGKIVFHSLERSSSSPSSLIGGPRFKHRGMERSYSGNVRVSPVLNVPVCSIKSGGMFGFPMFTSGSNNGGLSRSLRGNNNKS